MEKSEIFSIHLTHIMEQEHIPAHEQFGMTHIQ